MHDTRSRRARTALHWLFKLREDRFDLAYLTANGPLTQLTHLPIPRPLRDLDAGDNMTIYVARHGLVTLGLVTSPPYLGGGFDPTYATDPGDVTTDHWYVDLSFSVDRYHQPIPWSVFAADPAFRNYLGRGNPIRLIDAEWGCVRRHFAQSFGNQATP